MRAVATVYALRFELSTYDSTRPLVIDPLVATWSTFLGTQTDAMYDDSAALATDSAGYLYVAGLTQLSTEEIPTDSFPTTPSSLNPANPSSAGDNCAFQCGYVLKLTPTHQVVYGALIYGLTINALAIDSAGAAYITGHTLDANLESRFQPPARSPEQPAECKPIATAAISSRSRRPTQPVRSPTKASSSIWQVAFSAAAQPASLCLVSGRRSATASRPWLAAWRRRPSR